MTPPADDARAAGEVRAPDACDRCRRKVPVAFWQDGAGSFWFCEQCGELTSAMLRDPLLGQPDAIEEQIARTEARCEAYATALRRLLDAHALVVADGSNHLRQEGFAEARDHARALLAAHDGKG